MTVNQINGNTTFSWNNGDTEISYPNLIKWISDISINTGSA